MFSISDTDIKSLYETVVHMDHSLYRPVRVGNNAQQLLTIVNHALEIERLEEATKALEMLQKEKNLANKRESDKKIKDVLLRANKPNPQSNYAHVSASSKGGDSASNESASSSNRNTGSDLNASSSHDEMLYMSHMSLWAKGFLLKLFSVEIELLRRALKSFKLDEVLDFKKLQQRRKRRANRLIDPFNEANNEEEQCDRQVNETDIANLIVGTKNYRVIKQREFFSENNTDTKNVTLEFEETNASIPLTSREKEFCKHTGQELFVELSELLQRLENRVIELSKSSSSDQDLLKSFIFNSKCKPSDDPKPSIPVTFPFFEDDGSKSLLMHQILTIILYIHFFLGVITGKGYGIDQLEDLSFQHFLFAADHGSDLCQGEIGHFYDSDHQVVYDYEIQNESISGQYYDIPFHKIDGSFIVRSIVNGETALERQTRLKKFHTLMARRYYKLSADQGYAITQSIYALLMEVVDVSVSIEYYEKAAAQGLREALFNLGNTYSHGIGVRADIAKAVIYYEQAALLGDPDAMLNVAVAYVNGNGGIKKDLEKAMRYFHTAAEQGNSMVAWYNLGIMYLRGTGVSKDLVQSTNCFIKAADMGYPIAQQRVATCYEGGQGCAVNQELAAKYYLLAANNGNIGCIQRIVVRLIEGNGIERDLSCAYQFLNILLNKYKEEEDEDGIEFALQQILTALNNAWPIQRNWSAGNLNTVFGD